MSAGTPPVEYVGPVAIYSPTASRAYFKLKWLEPDGFQRDTTAGRTLDGARLKASDLARRLDAAASPHATRTLAALVEDFVKEGRSPFTRRAWQATHQAAIEKNLNRMLRGRRHLRAMDLDRDVCDAMRAQAGTDAMVRANTSALRAFLQWGHQHANKYFTAAQADLLPRGCVRPRPALRGTEAPSRRRGTRAVGEDELYISDEDAPSLAQVRALAAALRREFPTWGDLAPELAANSGARWGEQFQLTADDVHLDGCAQDDNPHIHIDWQINAAAKADDEKGRRCRPKGNKTRLIPVPRASFTGFPLRATLAARVRAALAEQAAGTNPQALLFPARQGGLLWHSAFEADHLVPAMRAAGWPLEVWEEVRDVWDEKAERYRQASRPRPRTLSMLPWHTLRHRFARIAIDKYGADPGVLMALGGWENKATVEQRYYRSGKEHTTRGLASFNRD